MAARASKGGNAGARRGSSSGRPPESLEQALGRAREHGRRALGEGVAALRALVEGTALAAGGRAGERSSLLSPAVGALEQIQRILESGGEQRGALSESLLAALDQEVERWERRSRSDPDARPVLRAFLGLRELLWELGVRRPEPTAGGGPQAATRGPEPKRARGRRLERVPVEG